MRMRVHQSGWWLLASFAGCLCAGLFSPGCSSGEGDNRVAEVSPYDSMPPGGARTSSPGGLEFPLPAEASAKKTAPDASAGPLAGTPAPGTSTLDTRFGANEVEQTLRLALSTARNGDKQKAAQLLDQVLAAEPTNREALLARAVLAHDRWAKDKEPGARTAAIEKAVHHIRALRRAFDSPKAHETELFGRILYSYAQDLAQHAEFDKATRALDEASDAGFECYFLLDRDEKMTELRNGPEFQKALQAHDACAAGRGPRPPRAQAGQAGRAAVCVCVHTQGSGFQAGLAC